MTTIDKVACTTPKEDHTSEKLENKESGSHSIDDINQKIVVEAEEEQSKADTEDENVMRNKPNHPLDLAVVTSAPCKSS